jgi:hypothetical protein
MAIEKVATVTPYQGVLGFAPGTTCVMGALAAAGVNVNLALTWKEVPTGL